MPTKSANLVVLESDKHAAVTRPIFGLWSLIQDQLESEQADLKHECPALFFILPVQREAERFRVEAERTLCVFDEEHSARKEGSRSLPRTPRRQDPVNTYSCCASRIVSRFPAPSLTTNSKPSTPGSMVRNEIEPSGFFRDATSLRNSPKSNTVRPPAGRTSMSPRASLWKCRASFAASAGSAGTVRSFRSAASCVYQFFPCAATSASASARPSNSTSRSLRWNTSRITQPGFPLVSTTAPTCCSGSHIMSLWNPTMSPP